MDFLRFLVVFFLSFYVTYRHHCRLNISQNAEGKQDQLLEEAFHLFIFLSCGGVSCWMKGPVIDEIRSEIGGETDRLHAAKNGEINGPRQRLQPSRWNVLTETLVKQ